jgi:hypothetical protein
MLSRGSCGSCGVVEDNLERYRSVAPVSISSQSTASTSIAQSQMTRSTPRDIDLLQIRKLDP